MAVFYSDYFYSINTTDTSNPWGNMPDANMLAVSEKEHDAPFSPKERDRANLDRLRKDRMRKERRVVR